MLYGWYIYILYVDGAPKLYNTLLVYATVCVL